MDVDKYKELCCSLGIEDSVLFINSVSDEDLVALFNGCYCFVFPSLYEGFGLPIIEAMNCGAPVLTSNLSACPEVAGDAAILVDPNNPDEISDGLNQICGNTSLRKSLIERGRERAKMFSWDKFFQFNERRLFKDLDMIEKALQQFVYLKYDLKRWKLDSIKTLFYNFFEQGIWGVVVYRLGRFLFLFDIPVLKNSS